MHASVAAVAAVEPVKSVKDDDGQNIQRPHNRPIKDGRIEDEGDEVHRRRYRASEDGRHDRALEKRPAESQRTHD